jgi:hypothetical protein
MPWRLRVQRSEDVWSAWHFDPVKPGIGHGILFHEPHPGGADRKITLRNAMVIGRRLRHAFGWCGDMVFVTKGPEGRRLSLEEVAKLKK